MNFPAITNQNSSAANPPEIWTPFARTTTRSIAPGMINSVSPTPKRLIARLVTKPNMSNDTRFTAAE